MQHLLSLFDISTNDLQQILATASHLKARLQKGDRPPVLEHRVLALLFEKPSLRTRVSFETGMAQLGGSSLFLGEDVGWGKRESPSDFTQVLGQFVDAVVCRTKKHERATQLAGFNALPVINGLTDLCHPCQALADVLTLQESFGSETGRHVVFVGDGNNVSGSLALICAMLKMRFTLACPEDYELEIALIARQQGDSPRRVRAKMEKRGQMDALRNQIIERKVINLIQEHADFQDVDFDFETDEVEAIDHFVAGGKKAQEIPEAKYSDSGPEKPGLPTERS